MREASMSRARVRSILLGAVATGLVALASPAQESETLFNQKCANCHGKDGGGHTTAAAKMAVPDLRSKRIREMSDAELTDSIANGAKHRDYPHAFLHTGLTNDQIAGLVKYVRVLQSEKKPPDRK
jgi:mono/diheme cytochrome c family protein